MQIVELVQPHVGLTGGGGIDFAPVRTIEFGAFGFVRVTRRHRLTGERVHSTDHAISGRLIRAAICVPWMSERHDQYRTHRMHRVAEESRVWPIVGTIRDFHEYCGV